MQQQTRQEQEPLDLPLEPSFKSSKNSELDELFRSTTKRSSSRGVSKPSLRPTRLNEAAKVAANARIAGGSRPSASSKKEPKLVDFDAAPKLTFEDDCRYMFDVDFNEDESVDYDLASTLYDIMESGNFLAVREILKDLKRFVTIQADNLLLMNWGDLAAFLLSAGETAVHGAGTIRDSFSSLMEQEAMLRTVTSIALICYGGSWAQLASIFAAVEAFGTKEVLEEAMGVFQNFVAAEPDDENDVTPRQIKDTFQGLGLQVALMIAVMFSPSWAEICIAVSFASKLTGLIPIEALLSKALSAPDMSMTSELEEWFQVVDDEWFALLSTLACNIFSLTIFGCFPGFVTAMYMGVIGLETLAESMPPTIEIVVPLGDMSVPVYSLDRNELFYKDNVHYVWAVNVFLSLWQAYSGFHGTFQFLSWMMFLLPIVKVLKMLTTGEWSDMDKLE